MNKYNDHKMPINWSASLNVDAPSHKLQSVYGHKHCMDMLKVQDIWICWTEVLCIVVLFIKQKKKYSATKLLNALTEWLTTNTLPFCYRSK